TMCPTGTTANPWANCTASPGTGTPKASGNFVISGNLFRTRDTFRQDIIDQSQLVHVLGVNPGAPPATAGDSAADSTPHCASAPTYPNASCLFNTMANKGIVIDPTHVYFLGQSLGGYNDTINAAV